MVTKPLASRALQIEQQTVFDSMQPDEQNWTQDCQSQVISIVVKYCLFFGGSHATSYTPFWHPVDILTSVTVYCKFDQQTVKGYSIPTNSPRQIIMAITQWLTSNYGHQCHWRTAECSHSLPLLQQHDLIGEAFEVGPMKLLIYLHQQMTG